MAAACYAVSLPANTYWAPTHELLQLPKSAPGPGQFSRGSIALGPREAGSLDSQ